MILGRGRGRRGRLVLLGLLASSRGYHLEGVLGGGLEVLIWEVVLGIPWKSPLSWEVPSRPSQASSLAGHLLQLHHGLGDTSWTSGVVTVFFKSPYFQPDCPNCCCCYLLVSPSRCLQHPTNRSNPEGKLGKFLHLSLLHSHFLLEFLSLCNKTHFSLSPRFSSRKEKADKFHTFVRSDLTNFFHSNFITFRFSSQTH